MKAHPFGRGAASLRILKRAALLLGSAGILVACSSAPFLARATPQQPQQSPAPQPQVPLFDLATSTEAHPQLWPLTPPRPRDPAVEAQVTQLLAQMTLEEKIGQMIQPDLPTVTPDDVTRYHLGSILNGGSAGPHGDLRAPAADWLATADQYYDASMRDRLHIPLMWGIDAVHGHGHIIGATLFPHNIALGAMHDPDLVRKLGEMAAQEIRVTGQDWTFAPTIAVVQDDRWGRSYEGFSENTDLVTENAAAMVEGLQGKPGTPDYLKNGHVLASIKHFIGDGATDNGVNAGNSTYSETALRDKFAPPYEAAIKAGAANVMVSYSGWRGAKMHGQKGLVSDVLVGRMGFDGFVISDYNGIADVAGCTADNCPQSVNAGVDMIMTAETWKTLYANLLQQVRSGVIPMSRIDEAVSRILRVKIEMGLMTAGRPSQRPYAGHYELIGSPEHRALARQAVRESMVLLKNDGGILPLSPRANVLVAGDGANNMTKQTGGWTITWQGTETHRADFPHGTTIYEGIKADVEASGGTTVLSEDGSFKERPDVAIVVIGEQPYAEGAGNLSTLEYQPGDKRDLRLIQRLQSQGVPVVVVFLSGRPLYVTPEINAANAFVAAWWPGTEGEGVSDLLFANPDGSVAYDFRGRLSFSWPRSPDQFVNNADTEPYFPLFPFGYGLTYGAPRNIGKMAEAWQPARPVMQARPLYESGDASGGWTLAAGGRPFTSSIKAQGLSVAKADDGLHATWATRVPVSLTISGIPASFKTEAERNLSLSITARVDQAPASTVVLGMGCGPLCGGKLDMTQTLRASTGWTTFNVPLSCLRSAGADLTAVTTPFALTSSGAFGLTISAVKVTRTTDALSCSQVPAVTAAAAVTSSGASDHHGTKKKAGGKHGHKKHSVPVVRKHSHRRH